MLMLYHGVESGGLGYYRVGAMLLDSNNPTRIIGKTPLPILEPETEFETKGYYNGCVFPTGNVIVDARSSYIMELPINTCVQQLAK